MWVTPFFLRVDSAVNIVLVLKLDELICNHCLYFSYNIFMRLYNLQVLIKMIA